MQDCDLDVSDAESGFFVGWLRCVWGGEIVSTEANLWVTGEGVNEVKRG